jgi:hypothetical protein
MEPSAIEVDTIRAEIVPERSVRATDTLKAGTTAEVL